MYYHKDLEPLEIATCLDLTECEIDQVRAEKVGLLKGMLAAQIGLPELPASFHKPGDVEGIGALVNSLGGRTSDQLPVSGIFSVNRCGSDLGLFRQEVCWYKSPTLPLAVSAWWGDAS